MFSHTIAALEKFDNQHDFERMSADILNSLGYKNVVPIAPRGGSDGGMDITFTTDDGKKGLACVTLRKDIDAKFKEDFSKRRPSEFGIYILFCTAYLTASQKSQFTQHCLNTLQAEFIPQDIEALRSVLDSTLQQIREKYLHIKSGEKEVIHRAGRERERASHNVSDPNKIRTGNRIERLYLIEKLLQQHSKLRTSELAKTLGVNDDTMRRDLDFLSITGRLPLIKEGWYWRLVKEPVKKSSDEKYASVETVKQYDYDVALSYASEDRGYVDVLATILLREGIKVFYDKYEKATLWGQDLYTYLSDIYQNKARYCVIFISRHYATKLWTTHERKAAQARAFGEQQAYILPIRLDETEIPGILPTIAYLSWHQETGASIAHIILEKVEDTPRLSKQQWIDESRSLSNKGYHQRALIASERAVRMDPYDSGVHYDHGCTLERQGRYEEALAEFERAIKLYPDDDCHYIYDVYRSTGDVLAKLEHHEEALTTYELAIKLDSGKDDQYRMSVSSAFCDKAELLRGLERYEEALTIFDQAILLEKEQTHPSRHNISQAQAGKGATFCNMERYEEALAVCEKAIHNDPRNMYGYNIKGEALFNLERSEEALTIFDKAIALEPKHPYAYQFKAYVLYCLKQYEEALHICEWAIELEQENATVYNTKGDILEALEHHEEAEQAYIIARRYDR